MVLVNCNVLAVSQPVYILLSPAAIYGYCLRIQVVYYVFNFDRLTSNEVE
jgi:hypothetical protein